MFLKSRHERDDVADAAGKDHGGSLHDGAVEFGAEALTDPVDDVDARGAQLDRRIAREVVASRVDQVCGRGVVEPQVAVASVGPAIALLTNVGDQRAQLVTAEPQTRGEARRSTADDEYVE